MRHLVAASCLLTMSLMPTQVVAQPGSGQDNEYMTIDGTKNPELIAHDLIFARRIDAGELGEDVEALLAIPGEHRVDVDLDADRHVPCQQALQPAVVLVRDDDRWHLRLMRFLVGAEPEACVAVDD